MALPPTRIYAYISTPERTFARLKEDGLLREDVDEAAFMSAMRAAEQSPSLPEGMVGPNITDQVAFALQSFLNEAGLELAHTPRYSPGGPVVEPEKTQEGDEESHPVKDFAGCLGGLTLLVGLHAGLYLGLLTVLGARPHTGVTTIHYVAGTALALFTSLVISLVGESLIEDVVKFVLLGGGAFAVWGGKTTPVSVIILGMAVGAFIPLLARLTWARRRRGESPR